MACVRERNLRPVRPVIPGAGMDRLQVGLAGYVSRDKSRL
jgi:hypothetical protein